MSDVQLLQSFNYLINTCEPYYTDYDIFNNNTNITLKTDYISFAFSLQNQYSCTNYNENDNFILNTQNLFIFDNIVLIINLLRYFIFANLANGFKYIINNKIIKINNNEYVSLLNYCIEIGRQYVCTLISLAQILDKYDFSSKLYYDIYYNTIGPISNVYITNPSHPS